MRYLASLLLLLLLAAGQAKTIVVDPSGSADATSLSGGIFLAGPGDTVFIRPGSYSGATVDRAVILSGSSESRIRGPLLITGPGCKIFNLTLESSGQDPAVELQSGDGLLAGCRVSGGGIGIRVAGTNNTVRDCRIEIPSGTGIQVVGKGNKIQTCSVRGNIGIVMNSTVECEVEGCDISALRDIILDSSTGNKIDRNTLSGSGFGIGLTKSFANLVSDNSLSGDFVSGIDMSNSRKNDIKGNSISGGKLGISLRNSQENNLTENVCRKTERAGIYADKATENRLSGNLLIGNGNGILLSGSANNSLIANNLTQNNYGITLRGSIDSVLRENRLFANSHNLRIDSGESSGAAISSSGHDFYHQDIDESNLAEEKPVRYLVEKSDMTVPADCGFLGIINCRNISASGLNITNSSAGILMVDSDNCRIANSSVARSEMGFSLVDCTSGLVKGCKAFSCQIGYLAEGCDGGVFEESEADSCSEEGFRLVDSMNMKLQRCVADSSAGGILLQGSRLCTLQDCTAEKNEEAGIQLIGSHKCKIQGNEASSNGRGISLSGSNSCVLDNNTAKNNSRDGISLEQLAVADVLSNVARKNGQGIFVQSSKKLVISKNNLSENSRYGLRMSSSTGNNVTDNGFYDNEIAGINLVDCRENFLYHNVLADNVIQNAADNGANQWDAGPKTGGNYWSDHDVQGNPGSSARTIPAKGVDRYPFHDPWGWR
jgi:parallel beta-helix repeat protein